MVQFVQLLCELSCLISDYDLFQFNYWLPSLLVASNIWKTLHNFDPEHLYIQSHIKMIQYFCISKWQLHVEKPNQKWNLDGWMWSVQVGIHNNHRHIVLYAFHWFEIKGKYRRSGWSSASNIVTSCQSNCCSITAGIFWQHRVVLWPMSNLQNYNQRV